MGRRSVAGRGGTTAEATAKAGAAHALSPLYHVLLALVSILLLGRWMGKLFVYFGQPRVIGEMVAGIMLGPSLLGQIWPAAQHFVLPADVAPYLGIIAQIGVILYMFLVGLELNAGIDSLEGARHDRHFAHEHPGAVSAGCDSGAVVVPALRAGRHAVHELRAVHGHRDVDHRVSRCSRAFSPTGRWKIRRWASSRSAARRSTT